MRYKHRPRNNSSLDPPKGSGAALKRMSDLFLKACVRRFSGVFGMSWVVGVGEVLRLKGRPTASILSHLVTSAKASDKG